MVTPQPAVTSQAELLRRVLAQEVRNTPWLDRVESRTALNRRGLPLPRKGPWQHSDVVALVTDALTLEGNANALTAAEGVESFLLDRTSTATPLASLGSSDGIGEYPIIDLNGLLFRAGAKLRVDASAKDAHVSIGDASGTIDRFLLSVSCGASVNLNEYFACGNRVLFCRVRNGARLDYQLTLPKSYGAGYHCLVVWLGDGAVFNLNVAGRGGSLRRNDVVVNIVGKDAHATLSGGWCLQEREHLDTQTRINHRIGASASTQTFHGVVDDYARSAFSGLIHIDRDANGTVAHLTNRNIAISPNARAVTQPDLEIYTDDVVCSHGATTGQLDDEAVFLLRSRGIGLVNARAMLVKGFLRQVVGSETGAVLLDL